MKFERGVEILLVNWGRSSGSSEAGGFHKVRVREWGGGAIPGVNFTNIL